MWFLKTTKKFFEPIKLEPRPYIQTILEAFLLFIYTVFSLEIFKAILKTIEYPNNEKFWQLIYIFLVISVLVSAVRFTTYKWWRQKIIFWWSKIYYEKYLKQYIEAEWNEVERMWTGRFISILEKWVYEWVNLLFALTMHWLQNILFAIYAFYSIFKISFIWWLLSLFLLFIWWIVATKANIYMKDKRMLRRKAQNEASHQTVIALMSKNELMQNNWLKTILWKISYNFEMAKIYQNPVTFWFIIVDELPKLLFVIIRIWVYIYLAKLIFLKQSSFSDLAIFVTILSLMELSMNNFLNLVREILREISSVELLWKTFENLTPIKWFNTWSKFKKNWDKIILKNITYWYTKNNIFNKFSLEINWLQKTALVWISGWWKTTLMKIIAWYLKPKSWTVEIFWNDMKKTSLKSYFSKLGYLTQEPSVFDWTIKENLQSSISTEANDEDMIKALKNAECDFVFEYEKWINTEIWEKWIRLSWWQRQRLAIAKIFMKDPEIILLDEPTSALDSFSEEKITKAMHRLFKWRTVLVIAHRLQTVKEADDIILIENWEIVERWTHRELVAKKWVYKNMLDLQSGF